MALARARASQGEEAAGKRGYYNMICRICGDHFELCEGIFEQRLIQDRDFCAKCFKEIMNSEVEDLAYLDAICLAAAVQIV